MLKPLCSAFVMLLSTAAWAGGVSSCEDSCKESIKACTDQCIKTQPKAKHPDCKKACGSAEQPCLDDCKKTPAK